MVKPKDRVDVEELVTEEGLREHAPVAPPRARPEAEETLGETPDSVELYLNGDPLTPMFAYYSLGIFQLKPTVATCDYTVAQTPHTGGMQVGLGDGSVRNVSASISLATWQAVLTPAGGEPLGSDW